MNIVFGHWKYIFRNLWFVILFAVVPALFIALSIDFHAISQFLKAFFTAEPGLSFLEVFRAWSLVRSNSALGVVYSVCAFASSVFFLALLLTFVEKHMRIGKRTMSGVFRMFKNHLLPTFAILLLFLFIYEVWAVVISAMCYTLTAISSVALRSALFIIVVVAFYAALLYVATIFYLWLPCMQISGMRAFSALLYSYRLMAGVRGKLYLSFLVSFTAAFVLLWVGSLLPYPVIVILAFAVLVFIFLDFGVRMETFYFYTDKIDREDLLLSYREL